MRREWGRGRAQRAHNNAQTDPHTAIRTLPMRRPSFFNVAAAFAYSGASFLQWPHHFTTSAHEGTAVTRGNSTATGQKLARKQASNVRVRRTQPATGRTSRQPRRSYRHPTPARHPPPGSAAGAAEGTHSASLAIQTRGRGTRAICAGKRGWRPARQAQTQTTRQAAGGYAHRRPGRSGTKQQSRQPPKCACLCGLWGNTWSVQIIGVTAKLHVEPWGCAFS